MCHIKITEELSEQMSEAVGKFLNNGKGKGIASNVVSVTCCGSCPMSHFEDKFLDDGICQHPDGPENISREGSGVADKCPLLSKPTLIRFEVKLSSER